MERKQLLASGAAAMILLAASPALADTNVSAHGNFGLHLGSIVRLFARDNGNGPAQKHDNDDQGTNRQHAATSTVSIFGTLNSANGTTLTVTAKNGTVYTVNAASATVKASNTTLALSQLTVGDTLYVRGTLSGSTLTANTIIDGTLVQRDVKQAFGGIAAGVVASVNGSTITIDRAGKATTTVLTNASTVIRGYGTSTAAGIQAGEKILVFGTTSTSTSNTIVADFIAVIGKGLLHLKHFFAI